MAYHAIYGISPNFFCIINTFPVILQKIYAMYGTYLSSSLPTKAACDL
jgi:hypothetical protein